MSGTQPAFRPASVVVALGTLALLLSCRTALALNPSLDVSQYAHTSWKARDALGGGRIEALAQTTDGHLWIGTDLGLFRFDGVTMVRWPPAPSATAVTISMVWGLHGARDGTLWISADDGVLTYRNGKTTVIPTPRGRRFSTILEDRDGHIWLGPFPPGLLMCRVANDAVDCSELPATYGPPTGVFFEDSAGSVWTGFDRSIARLKPDPRQWFPRPSQLNGYKGLVEENGALLVGVPEGMARLAGGKTELVHPAPPAVTPLPPVAALRDRDGALWMATYGRGLWHVHDGRTDVFTAADGLSGDSANLLFEDREGNIWVATDDGLDRFRDVAVPNVAAARTFSNGTVTAVLAATDGSLWVATLDGLNHRDGDRLTVYRERNRPAPRGRRQVVAPGFPERGQSLLQDRAGRIWASDRRAVGYLDGDRFVPVLEHEDVLVLFIIEDAGGDIWVSTRNQLARVRGDRVLEALRWSELGVSHATAALADPGGGLWLGLNDGGIAYYRNHGFEQRYSVADGVGAGRVNHFRAGGDGAIWAATEGGLTRIKAGRASTLNTASGLPCDAVHWSTADAGGSVWLYTPCGLLRVPHDDLDAWAAGAADDRGVGRRVRFSVFDGADGVRLLARPIRYHPQVTTAPDGRIWFSTLDGVAVIDARNIRVNALAPPVHIEQVIADRTRYEATSGLRLPPLVRNLQIDYAALSLVVPQKNRFQVMLEGRDRDWQDVGTRREAFYTDLAPGSYRFRVKGSNNDGVWNEAGAAIEFSIAPAYYQTRWFITLVAGSAAAALWVGYLIRVRRVARDYQQRLNERVNERTRIARELHDTLLQSFNGLLLRFQTASQLLPERPVEAKEHLDRGIEHAAKAITEGRDAVQGLRASIVERHDLAVAIRTVGEELAVSASTSQPSAFHVAVEGRPRDLHAIVRDETYKIAAESLRNAFRHAFAGRVEVEIRYDDEQFRLRVRDDGKGIDPAVLAGQSLEGHYGLRGMPERAALIGGKVAVWSEVGAGTEVELRLPASAAYPTPTRRSWWSRPRLR